MTIVPSGYLRMTPTLKEHYLQFVILRYPEGTIVLLLSPIQINQLTYHLLIKNLIRNILNLL